MRQVGVGRGGSGGAAAPQALDCSRLSFKHTVRPIAQRERYYSHAQHAHNIPRNSTPPPSQERAPRTKQTRADFGSLLSPSVRQPRRMNDKELADLVELATHPRVDVSLVDGGPHGLGSRAKRAERAIARASRGRRRRPSPPPDAHPPSPPTHPHHHLRSAPPPSRSSRACRPQPRASDACAKLCPHCCPRCCGSRGRRCRQRRQRPTPTPLPTPKKRPQRAWPRTRPPRRSGSGL